MKTLREGETPVALLVLHRALSVAVENAKAHQKLPIVSLVHHRVCQLVAENARERPNLPDVHPAHRPVPQIVQVLPNLRDAHLVRILVRQDVLPIVPVHATEGTAPVDVPELVKYLVVKDAESPVLSNVLITAQTLVLALVILLVWAGQNRIHDKREFTSVEVRKLQDDNVHCY